MEAALRSATEDLNKSGRPWALVGGFAVSARAEPRFTSDVDIAVMVDGDAAAEELVYLLISDGYVVFSTIEHDNGRLATARMNREFDGIDIVVDLLFASSGIEPEVAQAAEPVEIVPGLILPVATIGHLIALKVLARDDVNRPQDLADLHALLRAAGPADLAVARDSLDLITSRGFNRSRNLRESLDSLTQSSPGP